MVVTLPVELIHEILKYCSQSEIANLAQTCQSLLQQSIPFLYHAVDLSTHNRLPADEPRPHSGILQYADSKPFRPIPPRALQRQHSFLHALIHHPEYATYVREFKWTLLFISDVGVPNPKIFPTNLIRYPETKLWDVFSLLTNVQKLDLASLHEYYVPYAADCPPSLFSSATSIRLLGWMSHKLAVSILHSIDPAKLTHLALDDLQDWGQYADGRPMCREDGLRIRHRTETTNPDGSRGEVFPGPMRGLLPRLEGRCTSLATLHLRIPSINQGCLSCYSVEATKQAYMEWASFLVSVRPTLQTLRIEHGFLHREWWRLTTCGFLAASILAMDHYLEVFVLPCLTSGVWRVLGRVEMYGVLLEPSYACEIQNVLKEGGQVWFEKKSVRPCAWFNGFVCTDLVPGEEENTWRIREEGDEGN